MKLGFRLEEILQRRVNVVTSGLLSPHIGLYILEEAGLSRSAPSYLHPVLDEVHYLFESSNGLSFLLRLFLRFFVRLIAPLSFLALASCTDYAPIEPGSLSISTMQLMPPGDSASVFEPYVAVNPKNPDQIVVGAQYGEGYNRGGLRFWIWNSNDGAESWMSRELTLRLLVRPPTMAADLSIAFGHDGAAYLFGISGDSVRAGVPDAALALAVSTDGGQSVRPLALLGKSVEYSLTAFDVSDKPWMIADRKPRSPFYGNLYFAWTRVSVRLDTDPFTITRQLVLSYSADQGQTFSSPVHIADEGMGAQLAARPDGALHVVWLGMTEFDGGGEIARIMHASSTDGGRTFSQPEIIESVSDTTETIDLPTLTDDAAGQLLACWSRGGFLGPSRWIIRCSQFEAGSGWSEPTVALPFSPGTTSAYPAVASSGDDWWLLNYESDSTETRVLLSRSTDGDIFAVSDTLARVPLSIDSFCTSPMLPCRSDFEMFTPGDYIKLAATPSRLVAAFVMPRSGDSEVLAEMWLSVIETDLLVY